MDSDLYLSAREESRSERCAWFAIKVRANREAVVAAALRGRGIEEFLPTYLCHRRWSDRVKDVRLPLFPGYVFGRFVPGKRLPILTIPGVVHIVGVQKRPIPIEDTEIEALQVVVRNGVPAKPWPFMRTGDRLTVTAGPLRGLEGLLISEKNCCRLVVSLTLLQRSVAVEVNRDWVIPAFRPNWFGRVPVVSAA